ncbi:hypothetical protein [Aequoribacter sp.]|uniref:hypothetical protein n=1 Tax=Aequoribacter sp. TaxID=2847771 RepID=UPI003F6A0608
MRRLLSIAFLGMLFFKTCPAAAQSDALDGAQPDPLGDAWSALIVAMQQAESEVRDFEYFDSEQDQARAYLLLSRALLKGIEEQLLNDPDFPLFRIMDPRMKEGGDNPDQRYSFAEIKGNTDYVIRGDLGSAARLEVQLYAGRPWANDGESLDYLAFEDIELDSDGQFEIRVLQQCGQRQTNCLTNPDNTTTVMVRQIYADWNTQPAGELHIDRMGFEGRSKAAPTPENVAQRIEAMAYTMHQSAVIWPQMVKERYTDRRPPNVVSPLMDTFKFGGARGRWMASGHFQLQPEQALVIKSWPVGAPYQGIQLTDLWFASLEYANRVTSLTRQQSVLAPDGAIYYVITSEETGYPNWLDTMGLEQGAFIMRYDGVGGAIEPSRWPSAQLVDLRDLPEIIPGFEGARITADDRDQQRALRRAHVQKRFGF